MDAFKRPLYERGDWQTVCAFVTTYEQRYNSATSEKLLKGGIMQNGQLFLELFPIIQYFLINNRPRVVF